MLIVQASFFSIPGIAIGLLMCYIFYLPIDMFLADYAGIPLSAALPTSAIIMAVVLGLVLPIGGIMIPIRRVLNNIVLPLPLQLLIGADQNLARCVGCFPSGSI